MAGLASLMGCGSSQPGLPDAESLVTIQQGVYGKTTSQDDVGSDNPVLPMGGFSILVHDHVPSLTFDQDYQPVEAPLVETRSDEVGFYQLELAAGRYVFCSSLLRCVWVDVHVSERVRLDHCFSVGPGWSQGEPVSG